MRTELYVGLKIPDTTAITTRRTLKRMGIPIAGVKRYQYYELEADADLFAEAASCDILVNHNKNTCEREIVQDGIIVLVREEDTSDRLKATLGRLGIAVTSVRAGTAWVIDTDPASARRAAEELLCNPNYQSCEVRA